MENKIKEMLSEQLSFPVDNISMDSLLIDDLGMDSFAAIEIMFAIENEFEVKITQDEVSRLKRVKDIIEKIRESKGLK